MKKMVGRRIVEVPDPDFVGVLSSAGGEPLVESIHVGKTKRREVLERAADLIDGDRQDDYGSPQNSFSRIAALWTLGIDNEYVFDAKDVAILLALLKVSRIVGDPSKEDSWVDLAGYAGLGAEVN